jgi:hypothetical protein
MTRTITFDKKMQEGEQRAAFQSALDEMGVSFTSPSSFERAFARTRDAADQNGEVAGDRLQAIVDDVVSGMEVFQGVARGARAGRERPTARRFTRTVSAIHGAGASIASATSCGSPTWDKARSRK